MEGESHHGEPRGIQDTERERSYAARTTHVRGDAAASPFQSKEIGESAISQVAPAIANAVYDAVGVRITDLPITAEKVFHAFTHP